ncbi:hypothetical protein [Rhodocytophaga aerolata]|uniref:hypothetical protein n=1 Tax=Rhodocytophaga aerolata TaxID=455078 RepID=UPI00366D7773
MAKKSKVKKKTSNTSKEPVNTKLSIPKKEAVGQDNRIGMHFDVSASFKREYKLYALQREMSMLEIFKESFALYKKVYPPKEGDR